MLLEEYVNYFLIAWTIIAIVVFVTLFFKVAPYGRFDTNHTRIKIPSRFGWIFMESPSVIGILCFYAYFFEDTSLVHLLMGLIWLSHYFHRTFIWPFRARLEGKKMSLGIALMAFLFNTINISLQSLWIFLLGEYADNWIATNFFILGVFIFFFGMYINIKSDNILINLRKTKGKGYHVPKGFLYKYVSCPNYLGELIEWFGWAILTLNPAGLVFLIWTFANLIPRARANHEWAIVKIENYPNDRKSIIPFVY